jgi:YesN/AraC family two-component response regulator
MKLTSPKTILVIEDDAITRNLFVDGLAAEGFNVIGAENGTIGIHYTHIHIPDVVICDIGMPDVDGYDVLTSLRKDPVTAIVPFIFLTCSGTKANIRKGMELGADDYVTKPSTLDELMRAIATQLKKQELIRYWYASQDERGLETISVNQTTEVEPVSQSFFPRDVQLKDVFDYIEANYDQGITLCDVANAVGYSAAYLTHRVAKQTGDTVNGWIVKRKMAAARCLLLETKYTIEQIATNLGYQNACHFSRQFRQHNEIPPQTWRKKHQAVVRLRNMFTAD